MESFPTLVELHSPLSLREEWLAGELRPRWAVEHPDLFDAQDVLNLQPAKYFYEWLAAIEIKKQLGLPSLVSKFGFHGHKSHPAKQAVLARCFSADDHAFLIADPRTLFGRTNGWPDLFVYSRDFTPKYFCEVKGGADKLRQTQIETFKALQDRIGTRIVVCVIR